MKICIKGIYKSFNKKTVISNLNWEIELNSGQIYGVVGPNGAGKTTILKIIAGILEYDRGTVQLSGRAINEYLSWSKSNIAFIPSGDRGLRNKNTVYENILYYGLLKGGCIADIKSNLNDYCKVLLMEDLLNKKIEELSMGQKKKTAVLSGLCSGKKLIILDEPSVGLDLDAESELREMLSTLADRTKTTLILSSHDADFLSQLAQNHVFLFSGNIVKQLKGFLDAKTLKELYFNFREGEKNETIIRNDRL